jgi:hypothetical protein
LLDSRGGCWLALSVAATAAAVAVARRGRAETPRLRLRQTLGLWHSARRRRQLSQAGGAGLRERQTLRDSLSALRVAGRWRHLLVPAPPRSWGSVPSPLLLLNAVCPSRRSALGPRAARVHRRGHLEGKVGRSKLVGLLRLECTKNPSLRPGACRAAVCFYSLLLAEWLLRCCSSLVLLLLRARCRWCPCWTSGRVAAGDERGGCAARPPPAPRKKRIIC